jgi:hypothetical protein
MFYTNAVYWFRRKEDLPRRKKRAIYFEALFIIVKRHVERLREASHVQTTAESRQKESLPAPIVNNFEIYTHLLIPSTLCLPTAASQLHSFEKKMITSDEMENV